MNATNKSTSKSSLASIALIAGITSLPAAASPGYYLDAALMVASRDSNEFQDERSARKAEKQSPKKDARKNERANEPTREHESDQPGYGYGYERRYPVAPLPPNPRFDDRGQR